MVMMFLIGWRVIGWMLRDGGWGGTGFLRSRYRFSRSEIEFKSGSGDLGLRVLDLDVGEGGGVRGVWGFLG